MILTQSRTTFPANYLDCGCLTPTTYCTTGTHTCEHTQTTTHAHSQQIILEKSGYLNSKIAPKQKHWTKRWFILKGSELKYYRTREYFFGYKRPKGLVNLALCCQLSRHETTEGMFELSTAKRTYLLAASTAQECDEWITGMHACMHAPSS